VRLVQGSPLPAAAYVLAVLVPDVVMINTFPRMSHIVEYMELTGEHRLLIVADLHLGTPSERHLQHRAALARAEATEGIAGYHGCAEPRVGEETAV
jgi:hypothetical protein